MKKILLNFCLLFVVVTFFVSNMLAQTTRAMLTGELLKGKVRMVAETQYVMQENYGKPEKPHVMVTDTSFYDERGNIVARSFSMNGGTTHFKYIYEFDQEGHKTQAICKNTKGYLILKFDINGDLVEIQQRSNSDQDLERYVYRYDRHNNQIENTELTTKESLYLR